MSKVIFNLLFIFLGVLAAYIIMAFTMPAINSIVVSANTSLVASANMSQFPGTQGMVESSPVWLWFLPGFVGIVAGVMVLVSKK